MTNASSNASPPRPPTEEAPRPPRPRVPHPRETRIGLVLYGGVALAVYINEVVQELFRLATEGDGPYADLRDRLGTDIVIDIISGTSAGGVNGIFLAKALTLGVSLVIKSCNDGPPRRRRSVPCSAPWGSSSSCRPRDCRRTIATSKVAAAL